MTVEESAFGERLLAEADSAGRAARMAAMVRSRAREREWRAGATESFELMMAVSTAAATSARALAPRLADAPLSECAKRWAVGESLAARAKRMSSRTCDWESANRWRRDS